MKDGFTELANPFVQVFCERCGLEVTVNHRTGVVACKWFHRDSTYRPALAFGTIPGVTCSYFHNHSFRGLIARTDSEKRCMFSAS